MSDGARTRSGLAVAKSVVVECDRDRAFAVFTDGFNSWWNPEFHIGTADFDAAIIEPRDGGRWYERGVDGSECDWGHVVAWEPPSRLVLAWQINGDWQYDPKLVTEVEVTFASEGPGRTRVELEHRNLERLGANAHEMHAVFDSEGGWTGLLGSYAKVVGA